MWRGIAIRIMQFAIILRCPNWDSRKRHAVSFFSFHRLLPCLSTLCASFTQLVRRLLHIHVCASCTILYGFFHPSHDIYSAILIRQLTICLYIR